ncbi:MAG: sulfite oxidase [Woeseiaceae bacterium]|jgi:cytochrome c|nr:sulfite oxidase [Woeseiaceae bacterium]|tara:strand:+ start:119 stop:727 length:609 start_codon:yes stop_codon:yes gene_type:complete
MSLSIYLKILIIFLSFTLTNFLNAQQNSIEENAQNDIDQITFNFGRPATVAEIEKWDRDVRPDGTGLPSGEGSVSQGEALYSTKCAFCHGSKGQGGINERLVAYENEAFPRATIACGFECRTIGNYWPYATTLFDYILRSMPMNAPGSLTDNEVYALSAYLLYLNKIIPNDTKLSATILKEIVMPAQDKFTPDDRLEYNMVH